MRYFSLFAGAGGGELAGLLLGWQLAGVVEKNKYCQEVLRARMFDGILPTLCIHDEIQSFSGHGWRSKVDLVIAAPPCQPWSQAGKRLGEDDPRNLWPETIRVVREIQPPLFFMEQSSRLASNAYFGKVLADLAQSGYDTQWSCLSAREVGAPHKRHDRLWLLACLPDALRNTLRIQPWWSEWSIRPSLSTMARYNLWPTPCAVGGGGSLRGGSGSAKVLAQMAAQGAITQCEALAMGANKRDVLPTPGQMACGLSTAPGGTKTPQTKRMHLNPRWVGWLMGWPPGWTDLKSLAMAGFHRWRASLSWG